MLVICCGLIIEFPGLLNCIGDALINSEFPSRYTVTLIATFLLALSGTALSDKKPTFREADKNGDNKVSNKEARQAGISEEEARATDLDGDVMLNKTNWILADIGPSDKSSDTLDN